MEHMQSDAEKQSTWISPTNFKKDIEAVLDRL
jgi:hypothetical protein